MRRRWLTLLLGALFGLCLGGYLLWTSTKVYETSSLIEMHARRPRILSGEGAILEDRASQWNASASIINTRLEKLGGVGTYESYNFV